MIRRTFRALALVVLFPALLVLLIVLVATGALNALGGELRGDE